ncbi:MAG TPA: ABC transporter permease subunit [bacterium]|nr:ABC transporter permease subunit [bacterium]
MRLSWPILVREVRGFLRSYKSFVCFSLFLFIVILFLISGWENFAKAWQTEDRALEITIAGKVLFQRLLLGQILILTVITPFLTAPAIASETTRGTIELLVSSPVSLGGILVQKLVSSMLFLVLLLIGSAPVMALCLIAGGLSGAEVAGTYVIILVACLMYGSIGMLCSTLGRKIYEVYLLTFGAILSVALLIPFHQSVWRYITTLRWNFRGREPVGWEWLSPISALDGLLFPKGPQSVPAIGFFTAVSPAPSPPKSNWFILDLVSTIAQSGIVPDFLFAAILISLVCLVVSRWRLGRIVEGPQPTRKNSSLQWIEFSSSPDETLTANGTAVKSGTFREGNNPAIQLERRVQWLGNINVTFRLFYIALMISIITLPLASFKGAWIFLSLPYLAAALFTAPLVATTISSERERNTFDLLITTLLRPREILQAKFRTSFIASIILSLALYLPGMFVVLGFGLAGYEMDLLVHRTHLGAILVYPFLLASSLFFFTALGLYCSVRFKRSNVSLLVSALAILGCMLLPLLIVHFICTNLPQDEFHWGFALMIDSAFSYLWYSTPLFLLLSPLGTVSALFPPGSINVADLVLSHPLEGVKWIGLCFTVIHCSVVLYLARCLLKRAEGMFREREE